MQKSSLEFPIAIHKEAGTVYGVTVPDVPGCHSWGDTIDDAIRNAREAIKGHVATLVELGQPVNIRCSTIEALMAKQEYAGAIWALADVDVSKLDARPERINVSLPRFVLQQIDVYVERRHETRSGFLARAALAALAQER